MERIQIALEKARAKRAEQRTAPAAAAQPVTAQPAAAPATAPVPPPAAPAVAPMNGRTAASAAPVPLPFAQAPSSKALENWMALPEFAPSPAVLTRNRVLGYAGGHEAGPLDMMRTRILQEMRRNGWRRMAVTSPNPRCGKTTTCANLAFSLARQSNQRTILLDLDMRRPGLARLLGLKTPQSIGSVIAGFEPPAKHLLRYGRNMAFGTNATPARNPAELLQGADVGPALAQIEADYVPTVMIFDMPPMQMCDDMLAFAPHVDCVLLLAAAESTAMDDLDRCERELSGVTNVLGVVLNKCRYRDPGYGYDQAY
jgi:protein-tyrosine kinase